MPSELEFELADNDAPSITTFSGAFTSANTNTSWRIQSCQIKADMLSLDNSLDNSYVNHLLGGNTLKLVYNTYISSLQTITSADTQVNVSRALTALCSVFMSLDKTFTKARARWHNKLWNTLYSTMIGDRNGPVEYVNVDFEVKHLQIMIGSKMYPEYPIASHAETFII